MKTSGPKLLLHLEGLVALAIACAIYRRLGASWLAFVVLFLAPDLFMLGYLAGKRTGARVYNFAHTYAVPCGLAALAAFAGRPAFFPFCVIWVAHIGFDRLLGFGLKYETDFKTTHLQRI